MGNNDTASYHMAFKYDYEKFMMKRSKKPHNTFLQMAAKIGINDFPKDKFEELRQKVYSSFKDEIDFIQSRPYVLETQNHIFVHAGIENRVDWENTTDTFALTQPFYLRENQCSGKWVVVGHFPCYNYKRSNNTNLPIIDYDKKMICIDGGLTIKYACQINAFCIDKSGNDYTYSTIWDTFFDKKIVLENFESDLSPIYIDPYNNKPMLINISNGLAHIREEVSDTEGFIPIGAVHKEKEGYHIWNNLNAFPKVDKGESVYCCRIMGEYAQIITEKGQVGWIPRNLI